VSTKCFSYVLIAVALLVLAACAPQGGPTPTATSVPDAAPAQASAAATAPSNVEAHAEPTANATPAPTTQASQASPTERPFAGEQAWIAYQTNRTGEGVWLIHPDGTEDHQIAADIPGLEQLPDWSPDGTRLVVTTRGGDTEPLYEYDLATNTSRQLFKCEDPCVGDDEPAYSPDGTQVAFNRALGPFVYSDADRHEVPSDCGIWIGDIATGDVRQITSNIDPPCEREYNVRWSPDGSQFTYWRDPYENGQPTGTAVFVMNVDGSGERRLTDPEMFAGDPDWSPDGEWIVFDTYPLSEFQHVSKVSNLYRMHPDGSGLEQLTHHETPAVRATQPRYTPDGRWIIFTAVTPSSRSLWLMPAEGGEPIVLARGGIYTHGTWQP
jgi:TolB protein